MPSSARKRTAWRMLLPMLLVGATVSAQQPHRRIEASPIDFATSQDDNLYSLVRSQEQIHEWEEALKELSAGEHRAAVERLHAVLQVDSGGVVPVAPGRFLGLRLAVLSTLANLPPAAEQEYEALVRREAGNLADADLSTLPREQLERLAQRFPTSHLGLAARVHLGDLALEAGDGLTAAGHFRTALDATRIDSAEERRVNERLHCAEVLSDPRAARAAASNNQLDAAGEDLLSVLPIGAERTDYPAYGGGGSGGTPMAPPAGNPEQRHWTEDVTAPGFQDRDHGELAMFPVGDLDGVFVNTGREVICFDALRRAISWVSQSPMRDEPEEDRFGRPLDGGARANPDMVLAAAVGGDVVVAVLQVPDHSQNVNFNNGLRIITKLALRRTFAFARSSGKQLWSHFDEIDGPRTRRFRGHDACGPPLVAGDTVYVPIHDRSGAIAFAIAAYDLHTGQPKWRRLVCSSQQDVNMFGNANMEFAASPLSLADGVLYGTSNLGVAFAVEARTGRLRWVSAYEVVRMPPTMMHRQQDRPVYFANNAPVVADDVVCCTPLDSPFVLGFDSENGRLLWQVPADATIDHTQNRVFWLAGRFDDEFVLSGLGAIAVKARPEQPNGLAPQMRQLVRPEQLSNRREVTLPARPAVTAEQVWFPRFDRILAFDRAGNKGEHPIEVPGYQPGNLLFVDGIVVSLKQRNFDVLMDAQALMSRVEARHRDAPDDPAAILRLATLRRALLPADATGSEIKSLQDLYRQGIESCDRRGLQPTHPVRMALQRELFDQARAAATNAQAHDPAHADELLAAARDDAPDQHLWIEVEAELLQRVRQQPERYRAELDRLEREAPDGMFPLGDGVPVRTFVLWQRALSAEGEPANAVGYWQQLLDDHGAEQLGDSTASTLAEAAIERLINKHGVGIYQAIAERADRALADAGSDSEALDRLARRYPNSTAAKTARLRLLDLAVQNGDLKVACDVLAQGLRTGTPTPGVLRRVLVAAMQRGNLGLAAAMADLLATSASVASDWPDDHGATYGAVLDGLRGSLDAKAATIALAVPAEVVARIAPRGPHQDFRLVPVFHAAGFAMPDDAPLYVLSGEELLAIDVHAAGPSKPILFAVPVQFLLHAYLCGSVLVVPDMEQLSGIDYRSGHQLWTLPNDGARLLECLGVEKGVVQMHAQSPTLEGAEVFGVEPTSGSVLWRRAMKPEELRPKQSDQQVLVLSLKATAARVTSLDPVTGGVLRDLEIDQAVLQSQLRLDKNNVVTSLYPMGLCADSERIYMPVDSSFGAEPPRLVAIDGKGQVAWQWTGTPGLQLAMAARRGDRLVVAESSDQRPGHVVLLRCKDGQVLRSADLGPDASVLNWQRSLIPNPAPAVVTISAIADLQSRQRELLCFPVDGDGAAFLQPLGSEDGEVQPTPQFGKTADGADFVAFCVQPIRPGGATRLYAIDLATREGVLPNGAKYQLLDSARLPQVWAIGPYTVVSSRQGILLLGTNENRK